MHWATAFLICVALLVLASCFSVVIWSITVAPDVLGYSSSLVRNSKYLHLPKHKLNSGMSGSERLRVLEGIEVMMQNVKANADVDRIALGLKHDKAEPLRKGRLYR
ncbi:uncharacterized protein FRV6_12906 [Fusarium oxysporum]|uniref:Uncharacterized protein n=1 Tax=Fusarium oxysporum TaxID=5507 RepID=A0A2H3U3V9_FUSOX|nr:uncharacterized protein FRV6_12906 [Fusarium oxysporum]